MIQPSNSTLAHRGVGPVGAASPPNPAPQTACGEKRETNRPKRTRKIDLLALIGVTQSATRRIKCRTPEPQSP